MNEGAFSQATLEMFERGSFLSTYLNGKPYYDKPMLMSWLEAASVRLFGASEASVRFPAALRAFLGQPRVSYQPREALYRLDRKSDCNVSQIFVSST